MISETFKVWAVDDGAAIDIAIKKYKNSEFVLSPGNLISKQMEKHNIEENTYSGWFEF